MKELKGINNKFKNLRTDEGLGWSPDQINQYVEELKSYNFTFDNLMTSSSTVCAIDFLILCSENINAFNYLQEKISSNKNEYNHELLDYALMAYQDAWITEDMFNELIPILLSVGRLTNKSINNILEKFIFNDDTQINSEAYYTVSKLLLNDYYGKLLSSLNYVSGKNKNKLSSLINTFRNHDRIADGVRGTKRRRTEEPTASSQVAEAATILNTFRNNERIAAADSLLSLGTNRSNR